MLPNFDIRLMNSMRPILPTLSPLGFYRPNQTLEQLRLSPWKGMSRWSRSEEFRKSSIDRALYDECGHEYLVEHRFGNRLGF